MISKIAMAQLLDIRDSGLTNMFDVDMVIKISMDRNYSELLDYIFENKSDYIHLILTGREER